MRDQVLEEMPSEQVAEALQQLDSDEAVYLIEDLDKEEQSDILAKLPHFERAALERSLEYPEDSAGRIMQTDLIAVPPFWSVGQTIDYMREAEDLPDRFYEIFVVDPAYHLHRLGGAQPAAALQAAGRRSSSITDRDIHPIRGRRRPGGGGAPIRALQSDLGAGRRRRRQAGRRDHRRRRGRGGAGGGVGRHSADGRRGRRVGVAIRCGRPPGIASPGCSSISARPFSPSFVISLFEATIEQMVALAVLMPIVASMGGNAGTQTMTVAVQGARHARSRSRPTRYRVIGRETAVGAAEWLVFACRIMAAIAFFWFGSGQLGLVIAAAMVVNLVVAALGRHSDPPGAGGARSRPGHRLGRVRHHRHRRGRLLRLSRTGRFVVSLGAGASHVLLSRQSAVVPAAAVDADRAC